MKFGFKELEQALATAHDVPSDKRSQFAARLRNLFRVGLDMPGGRVGRRTNYGPEDLLKMTLAVEFLQFGILPETAIKYVAEYWLEFRKKIARVYLFTDKNLDVDCYMSFSPSLITNGKMVSGNFHRMAGSRISIEKRAIIIDVNSVWDKIVNSLEDAGIEKSGFIAEIDTESRNVLQAVQN